MIELKPITSENYVAAVKLEVAPGQENFVASNCKSLVQAHYEPQFRAQPLGIYHGDTMVGFMMTIEDDEVGPETKIIMRFMIGADHQRKGYARTALMTAFEQWRGEGRWRQVALTYVPANEAARALYASVGFVEQGIKEEYGGEMLAICPL